jgi:hypothetical protein
LQIVIRYGSLEHIPSSLSPLRFHNWILLQNMQGKARKLDEFPHSHRQRDPRDQHKASQQLGACTRKAGKIDGIAFGTLCWKRELWFPWLSFILRLTHWWRRIQGMHV